MSKILNITTNLNGEQIEVGPGGPSGSVGVIGVQFVPDANFIGALAVLGRLQGPGIPASPEVVSPVPVPYRAIYLNGAASDYHLATDLLTAMSVVQVPSNGLSIVFQISCTQGTAWLYTVDLQGSGAV